ncbi:MAG: hypothetical protein ABI836_04565 [Gemmatimonadota bacterium]
MSALPAVAESGPLTLGTVVVIGGGCYGSFYTKQLETARERGKVSYRQILVVDRDPACQVVRELPSGEERQVVVDDWSHFLDGFFAGYAGSDPVAVPPDVIVPSPLMPHLMYEWLFRRARERWPDREVRTVPFSTDPGTPYDATAPDHTRYVSHADWICPTHCTEPARCPVIRAPRTWEMSETMERWTRELDRVRPTWGPVLLECRHTVFAVGTFSVAAVLAGDRIIADAGARTESVDVLVGTVSACHGAVNLLHVGPGNP